MLLSIEQQLRLIMVSIISGVSIGILFDIYRIYRNGRNFKKYTIFIQDIFYWFFCSIIIFLITLKFNDAYINFYGYIIMALSFLLYLFCFSRSMIKVLFKSSEYLGSLLRIILKYMSYPFYLIFKSNTSKNTAQFSNKKLEKK